MSKLNILTYPDKFLSQPTQPLNNIDGKVQEMIDKMALTMYDAPGIGLAAIQVGWNKSVLIYDVSPRESLPKDCTSTSTSGLITEPWNLHDERGVITKYIISLC